MSNFMIVAFRRSAAPLLLGLLLANAAWAQNDSTRTCYRFPESLFKSGGDYAAHADSTAIVKLEGFGLQRSGTVVPAGLSLGAIETRRHAQFSYWSRTGGDSIEISWRNGFYGPLIVGVIRGDSLIGLLRRTTDDGVEPPATPIRAVRLKCPNKL